MNSYSAMAPFDYTSVNLNQMFSTGSADGATECVNIHIIDDNALEANQTFSVILSTMDPDDEVMIAVNITVIIIIDNDGMHA